MNQKHRYIMTIASLRSLAPAWYLLRKAIHTCWMEVQNLPCLFLLSKAQGVPFAKWKSAVYLCPQGISASLSLSSWRAFGSTVLSPWRLHATQFPVHQSSLRAWVLPTPPYCLSMTPALGTTAQYRDIFWLWSRGRHSTIVERSFGESETLDRWHC